jgi:hypothetical protein
MNGAKNETCATVRSGYQLTALAIHLRLTVVPTIRNTSVAPR